MTSDRVEASHPWGSDHLFQLARVILASAMLVIVYIDPSEPERYATATYSVLLLYVLFAALLTRLGKWNLALSLQIESIVHWIDALWFGVLVLLTNSTGSVFFSGFYFSILVASFRWGFLAGFRVTLVSSGFFALLAVSQIFTPGFEWNRFLLRSSWLIILGYLMSYWGEFELLQERRLSLLKDLSGMTNPRFGIDRAMGSLLRRLREFFEADSALFVEASRENEESTLRRHSGADRSAGSAPERISAELAAHFFCWPEREAFLFRGRRFEALTLARRSYTLTEETPIAPAAIPAHALAVQEFLETDSFITVPVIVRGKTRGRIYITAGPFPFRASDLGFLWQVARQMTTIFENIELADQLAAAAAHEERRRLARDLHDGVIQPYIGLRIGLGALQQKLADGRSAADEIEHLIRLTEEGVAELRRCVLELKEGSRSEDTLVLSLKRFARRFSDATGIDVRIDAPDELSMSDRLAGEIFHLVSEGVSNVRRHTESDRATVILERRNGWLSLQIQNSSSGQETPSFRPRSLEERTAALGGRLHVDRLSDRQTVVLMEIPING